MDGRIRKVSSARRIRDASLGLASAVVLGASALLTGAAGQAADGVPRMPDGHPDLSGTWDNGSG
ncbi:MAG TPA: hypothetical protein VL131_15800, partial [Gammaproteobacteria bacterium]|nr:hypothetical protein [Gammaproteobacteria bacterium]